MLFGWVVRMRNEVKIKVFGLNLTRFINRLVAKNILVNNIVIKNKFVKFSIAEKDFKLFNDVCKQEKRFYVVVGGNGLKKLITKLPFLLGSFLAILIIYVYLFSFSFLVFDVNVIAGNLEQKNQIETVLKNYGICSGMTKNKFSNQEIERIVIKNVRDVSGCSVKIEGGTLNILILSANEKEDVFESDLVSKFDAVVTRCEVFAGTSNVKVGDVVKKGDVLIKNNNGAQGIIEGKICFSAIRIHNENQQIIKKTGRYVEINNLSVNKFAYKTKLKHNFSSYLIQKCGFYISFNYLIPIVCEKLICFETVIEDVVVPFYSVENQILNSLKCEVEKAYGKEVDESDVSFSVVTDGPYTRVDCFLQVVAGLF